MAEKNIYPEIRRELVTLKGGSGYLVEDAVRITLETYLRKKYRGRYYLQRIWQESYCPVGNLMAMSIVDAVNRFHENVYRALILSKVDTKIIYPDHMVPDRKMFELDKNNQTEEERLTPVI